MDDDKKKIGNADANRDPITGEPGAHPVGTGVGAAGMGAAGAVIGAAGGPVGSVIGAAIGGIVGGLVGKSAAEAVNPTVEEAYWQENYTSRPYYTEGRTYEDYQPAYRTGYESYGRYSDTGRTYDEVEPELQRNYEANRANSSLGWNEARHASRDAWERVDRRNRGFVDEDAYWRQTYSSEPYYEQGLTYEDFQPGYYTGYQGYDRYRGRTFDEVEPDLRRDYERDFGSSHPHMGWEKVKHAARRAWDRVENTVRRDR